MLDLYKDTKFSEKSLLDHSAQILKYLRNYDSKLFAIFKAVDVKLLQSLLLRFSLSCGLHVINNVQFSCLFARLQLSYNYDQQMYIM